MKSSGNKEKCDSLLSNLKVELEDHFIGNEISKEAVDPFVNYNVDMYYKKSASILDYFPKFLKSKKKRYNKNTGWELYNIEEDPIKQVNVADQYPEKVKELEKIFWEEAEKYDVYPVGGPMGRMLQPESNPQRAAKKHWELTPNVYRVPELADPEVKSTDYGVNAYITPNETTEDVIYAIGEHIGGQGQI